jgi:hypothetical protein
MFKVRSTVFMYKMHFQSSEFIQYTHLPSTSLSEWLGGPDLLLQKIYPTSEHMMRLWHVPFQAYLAELEKPYRSRRGLRTICKDFEQLYFEEMGVEDTP